MIEKFVSHVTVVLKDVRPSVVWSSRPWWVVGPTTLSPPPSVVLP